MIPQTYPSTLSANNRMQMVVFVLTDVTGLTRWVDYIPVKPPTTLNTNFANTFETQGYLLTSSLSSISGKQAWLDYIPVYIDYAATIPYSTNASGYIPMDVFVISNLFAAGEQGVWYDPSDFSTMFQDAAGTIPVTAVGQPVGRILDKSGRGNHATQTTSTKRPVLQQDANGKYYLLFDGIDDALQTASINFTATDKVTVWAGVRKLAGTVTQIIAELSSTAFSTDSTFSLRGPTLTSDSYAFTSRGTIFAGAEISGYPPPHTSVLTGIGNISGDSAVLKVNGVQVASTITDQGTGNFGNYPLYIGSRGGTSNPFNGRLYSLIIRGAQSTAAQISNTETYVNSKTGAY